MRTIRSHGIAERVYSFALPGKRHLVVQVARSMEPEEDALHGLLAYMLLGVAGSLALAAAGGWFLAGKSLAPVRAAFERQQAFVADASHELRTPLAVIRANAEFLQQGQPESEEAAEILAETDRLTALVDSLLALARGQGAAAADHPLDLGALVSDSAQSMQPLASDRKVALAIDTTPGLEVEGDPDQLRRLVVILVDNALRYTPAGGRVTVDAHRNDGTAVVAVSDTGIGIPADALQHVFERFYRADGARNRASGGAGLGLSIAEQLVTAHGGRISAESAPGRGSTFTISLPLGRGPDLRLRRRSRGRARRRCRRSSRWPEARRRPGPPSGAAPVTGSSERTSPEAEFASTKSVAPRAIPALTSPDMLRTWIVPDAARSIFTSPDIVFTLSPAPVSPTVTSPDIVLTLPAPWSERTSTSPLAVFTSSSLLGGLDRDVAGGGAHIGRSEPAADDDIGRRRARVELGAVRGADADEHLRVVEPGHEAPQLGHRDDQLVAALRALRQGLDQRLGGLARRPIRSSARPRRRSRRCRPSRSRSGRRSAAARAGGRLGCDGLPWWCLLAFTPGRTRTDGGRGASGPLRAGTMSAACGASSATGWA